MDLVDTVQEHLEPGEKGEASDAEDPYDRKEWAEMTAEDLAHIATMGPTVHGSRPPKEQREATGRKGYPENAYTVGDLAVGVPLSTAVYAVPPLIDAYTGGADLSTAILSTGVGKNLLDAGLRTGYTAALTDGKPLPGLLSWKTAGLFAYDFGKRGLKKVLPDDGEKWVDRQDAQLQVGLDILGDSIGDWFVESRDALDESLKLANSPEYRRLNDHLEPENRSFGELVADSYDRLYEGLAERYDQATGHVRQ